MLGRDGVAKKIFDKYGDEITKALVAKLKRDKTWVSGKTGASVSYRATDGSLEIWGSPVFTFLDKGTNPVPKGRVSRRMVNNIIAWMKSKNIQPRRGKTGRFVSRTETNYRANAFVIARSISNKGIIARKGGRGTNILGYILNKRRQRAMSMDLLNAFGMTINEKILLTFKSNGFTEQ